MAVMAAERTELGLPFTRADLEGVPEDSKYRYEIIDGVLIVSAAPGRLHQRAVGRLYRRLDDACPPDYEVLVAPFSVGLAEDTKMQPDILVARFDQLTDQDLPGRPELAVEMLSPSTRLIDLNVKKARFERAGTPSFWVVDPVARPAEARLIAWELTSKGRYRQVADVRGNEKFLAELPYPVPVIPAELVG